MIDKTIAARIVEVLNEALALDPDAVSRLVDFRPPCNDALADHPSIQVGRFPDPDGPMRVGLLGLLNGIAGANEDCVGAVAVIVEESGAISGFTLLEDRVA